jgi:hypothetical protein
MGDHPPPADETAPPVTTIASLPCALLARVLARVPVDTRLRCCEVSAGWNDFLATERSLWTALDLTYSSGVTHKVTNALLRASAAKAGGALTALDVSDCYGTGLSYDALLAVVSANADSLLEMRLPTTFGKTEALLRAAPRLRLLDADVHCDADDATRMLRNEGVFKPLRIRELHVETRTADAALHAFTAALAVHAWPLPSLRLDRAELSPPAVLDALVDAALANRLAGVSFWSCGLSPETSVPSLARLLGGSALTSLEIYNRVGAPHWLPDAHAAALLGGALRSSGVLQHLTLDVDLWRDGFVVMALLTSLVAHPSLRGLDLSANEVAPEHAASAGTALFALVAANAPALGELELSDCNLGDAGLRPLFEALPRNTHLRALRCAGNDMSEAFARDVLLPAVHANMSLTVLQATLQMHGVSSALEAENIVRGRR